MAKIGSLTEAALFRAMGWVLILVLAFAPGDALAAKTKGNAKYASIVMDAQTGEILSQSEPDKRLHPASLTKVMTLLMLFEAIERGETSLSSRIKISKHAASMSPSKLGLKPGSTIKVKDAILALVTKSANDIAAAVAEHVGGSESAFARQMTARAHQIGMNNTTFKNASGLHHSGQYSSARDMAKLARFVITQYPAYYRYFSTANFYYGGKSYHNHNRLMGSYKGMDGMKTGYTVPSGFNLVASAVRDNRRLIGVVFGGRSTKSRNDHMAELLNRGFAKSPDLRIASAQPNAVRNVVSDSPKASIPLDTNVASLVPNDLAPVPARKPQLDSVLASLESAEPAAGAALQPRALAPSDLREPETASTSAPSTHFEEMVGEGDFDPGAYKRIETGLLAMAAYQGKDQKSSDLHRVLTAAKAPADEKLSAAAPASYQAISRGAGQPWSVQVGAYTSRAATDEALHRVLKQIPQPYASAQPMIAPLKTADGWLFRARLTGLSRTEALAACNYIRDCLPVAPQN